MSDKYYASTAADLVRDNLPQSSTIRKVFPLDIVIAAIMALIDKFIACRKTPTDAVAHLNWIPERRPFLDWLFGTGPAARLADHRRGIRIQMRKAWTGPAADFDAAADAMFATIDSGKVDVALMEGLYSERHGY